MTPEQIIKQISAGGKAQNEALKALYQTKAATFKRYFLHKGIHPNAVEDVLQDTIVKIFKNAGSYHGQGGFSDSSASAWMNTIASNCMHDQFDKVGRSVHTDKAYASRQRRQMLQLLGFVDAMQRRAQPDKPLSECQKRRIQRIASKRARVEHAFAGIRHMGGKFVRTIGQARATVAMTMMAACYNLKRLASFLERGVDAFFKPATTKAQVRLQTAKA